ncbi:hypothetical protein [Streptomyces sp. NPDC045251]|uniref:hypothetical protein n=1 Tax=unclassified Streptomyces TaxID=2593676 RepID=UPI0033DD1FA9
MSEALVAAATKAWAEQEQWLKETEERDRKDMASLQELEKAFADMAAEEETAGKRPGVRGVGARVPQRGEAAAVVVYEKNSTTLTASTKDDLPMSMNAATTRSSI